MINVKNTTPKNFIISVNGESKWVRGASEWVRGASEWVSDASSGDGGGGMNFEFNIHLLKPMTRNTVARMWNISMWAGWEGGGVRISSGKYHDCLHNNLAIQSAVISPLSAHVSRREADYLGKKYTFTWDISSFVAKIVSITTG